VPTAARSAWPRHQAGIKAGIKNADGNRAIEDAAIAPADYLAGEGPR
jgi:hypothetical protein